MSIVKPFKAIRPAEGYDIKIAELPYDVMSSDEAREIAAGNPYSFLHVDKAEIDLPAGTGLYDDIVYETAKKNFDRMVAEGAFMRDDEPCYYIYRLKTGQRSQAGIAAAVSIDDYLNSVVKKHELTRPDKERDRIRHVDSLNANTGPIYLTCRPHAELSRIIMDWMCSHPPVYDFASSDGVAHTVWVVDGAVVGEIEALFRDIDSLYIADGHHRAMSGVRVGQMRREANPGYTGDEDFNYFMSIIFPADQLHILDYNRVVTDLNGMSVEEFIEALSNNFDVVEHNGEGSPKPKEKHSFAVYVGGSWYSLTAKPGTWDDSDPKARLDVSILQNNVLSPLLGIDDPRTSDRIDFVGGIRGLGELERRAHADMELAFAMFPTTMDDLMDIADAGLIMPPKSTWFEPKPRSGLLIHSL
ncbi:MAG: DUF1015 family protein [Clostridiales Family XIII bacterium]|jgi:uncharacterized protein (DUF1015 family)|nr:DUF1015 family protein [Clostridiales Family XIII bacterium]